MRCKILLVIAMATTSSEVLVPGSRSPDGTATLLATGEPAGRLVLQYGKRRHAITSPAQSDLPVLFGCVVATSTNPQDDGCRDFVFAITWSADSKWLAIDGGMHKFWAWSVIRVAPSGPVLCAVPSRGAVLSALRRREHLPHRRIRDSGTEPMVVGLEAGVFGVLSHPFAAEYENGEGHVYLIVDFRNSNAGQIIGIGDIDTRR